MFYMCDEDHRLFTVTKAACCFRVVAALETQDALKLVYYCRHAGSCSNQHIVRARIDVFLDDLLCVMICPGHH